MEIELSIYINMTLKRRFLINNILIVWYFIYGGIIILSWHKTSSYLNTISCFLFASGMFSTLIAGRKRLKKAMIDEVERKLDPDSYVRLNSIPLPPNITFKK